MFKLMDKKLLKQFDDLNPSDFQQCGNLTSVDSDEAVQPPFKLRNTK